MYACMYMCIEKMCFNGFLYHRGHATAVRLLLSVGIDVNTADNQGFTALHLTADKGDIDFLQALIENGSEINSQVSILLNWGRRIAVQMFSKIIIYISQG